MHPSQLPKLPKFLIYLSFFVQIENESDFDLAR